MLLKKQILKESSTEELDETNLSAGNILTYCAFSQGTSAGGVKRAKVETWEKSVGTLGGGGALGSLVVRKKPRPTFAKPHPVGPAAPKLQTGNTSAYLSCLYEGCLDRIFWKILISLIYFLTKQLLLHVHMSTCVISVCLGFLFTWIHTYLFAAFTYFHCMSCFSDSKKSVAVSNNVSKPVTTQNGSSSLSLLGAYSDSDSNDSEWKEDAQDDFESLTQNCINDDIQHHV